MVWLKELQEVTTEMQRMQILSWCSTAATETALTIKSKQQDKFEKLQGKQRTPQLDRHRVVKNISSRPLTENEERVLALGLNFAITPRQIPYRDIITTVESTARQLSEDKAKHLRKTVSEILQKAKRPKDNLDKHLHRAVRDLRKNDDITILPADKGNATVIMDCTEYEKKMLDLLADPTYRRLKRDPTTKVEKRITEGLKALESTGYITVEQRKYLAPQYSSPPQLYGLPKIGSPSSTDCLCH